MADCLFLRWILEQPVVKLDTVRRCQTRQDAIMPVGNKPPALPHVDRPARHVAGLGDGFLADRGDQLVVILDHSGNHNFAHSTKDVTGRYLGQSQSCSSSLIIDTGTISTMHSNRAARRSSPRLPSLGVQKEDGPARYQPPWLAEARKRENVRLRAIAGRLLASEWTDEQLAKEIGQSRESVVNYRSRLQKIPVEFFQLLKDITSLPLEWFLDGDSHVLNVEQRNAVASALEQAKGFVKDGGKEA